MKKRSAGGKKIQMDSFFWLLVIFALLRLWLGQMVGIWFSGNDTYDDVLIINYANLKGYFMQTGATYISDVMLKEMGMPFILQLVNFSGIPYSAVLSLLWILNGLLAAKIVYGYTKNKALSMGIYIFILFQPSAFDDWCGTRLYRAGLLNPLYLLVLLLALVVFSRLIAGKATFAVFILEGIVFSLTYYVKEDGLWLLMTLLFMMLFWIAACVIRREELLSGKKWAGTISRLVIPLIIFACFTAGYKGLNHHFFGVYETNMRTKGEPGRFVEMIYKIDAPDKTDRIWASKEAIEAAFEASPTLKAHPKLKDEIFHSYWLWEDIDENPIAGDFLTWILKDAAFYGDVAQNQAEKQAFFKTVNAELEEAFRNGTLARDRDRIHLVSSLGGFSREAIGQAFVDALDLYRRHILLAGYVPGSIVVTGSTPHLQLYEEASALTNMELVPIETGSGIRYHEIQTEIANGIVNVLFWIYRIAIPCAIVISTIGLIYGFYYCFKKSEKKNRIQNLLLSVLQLAFLGISFVYNYMIALFCMQYEQEFIAAEKMYSVGVVSLLCLYIILGIVNLCRNSGRKRLAISRE